MPPTVSVPENQTTAQVPVTAGNNVGSATITANATGFTSDTSTVNVSNRAMTIAIDSPLVGIGRTIGGTVTLAQPAGPGGVSVTLTSSNNAVATVSPPALVIPEGQAVGAFMVTGVAVGDAQITAAASGFDPDNVSVTVTDNLISFGFIPDISPSQSAGLPLSISSPAAGDLTVNFVSSDPSIATVTPSTVRFPPFPSSIRRKRTPA